MSTSQSKSAPDALASVTPPADRSNDAAAVPTVASVAQPLSGDEKKEPLRGVDQQTTDALDLATTLNTTVTIRWGDWFSAASTISSIRAKLTAVLHVATCGRYALCKRCQRPFAARAGSDLTARVEALCEECRRVECVVCETQKEDVVPLCCCGSKQYICRECLSCLITVKCPNCRNVDHFKLLHAQCVQVLNPPAEAAAGEAAVNRAAAEAAAAPLIADPQEHETIIANENRQAREEACAHPVCVNLVAVPPNADEMRDAKLCVQHRRERQNREREERLARRASVPTAETPPMLTATASRPATRAPKGMQTKTRKRKEGPKVTTLSDGSNKRSKRPSFLFRAPPVPVAVIPVPRSAESKEESDRRFAAVQRRTAQIQQPAAASTLSVGDPPSAVLSTATALAVVPPDAVGVSPTPTTLTCAAMLSDAQPTAVSDARLQSSLPSNAERKDTVPVSTNHMSGAISSDTMAAPTSIPPPPPPPPVDVTPISGSAPPPPSNMTATALGVIPPVLHAGDVTPAAGLAPHPPTTAQSTAPATATVPSSEVLPSSTTTNRPKTSKPKKSTAQLDQEAIALLDTILARSINAATTVLSNHVGDELKQLQDAIQTAGDLSVERVREAATRAACLVRTAGRLDVRSRALLGQFLQRRFAAGGGGEMKAFIARTFKDKLAPPFNSEKVIRVTMQLGMLLTNHPALFRHDMGYYEIRDRLVAMERVLAQWKRDGDTRYPLDQASQ